MKLLEEKLDLHIRKCFLKRLDGLSNMTYLLTVMDEKGRALQFSIKVYEGSHQEARGKIRTEYYATRLLRQHGIETPRIIYADFKGEALGKPYMIRVWVNAKSAEKLLDRESIRDEVLKVLAHTLVQIHKIPLTAIDSRYLHIPRSVHEYLDAQVRWLEKLGHSLSLRMQKLIRWLRENMPFKDELSLPHGDYGLDNVLIDDQLRPYLVDLESFEVGTTSSDVGYAYLLIAVHEGTIHRAAGLACYFIGEYHRRNSLSYEAPRLHKTIWRLQEQQSRSGCSYAPLVENIFIRLTMKYLRDVIFSKTSVKVL